jgi:hypothetical protein
MSNVIVVIPRKTTIPMKDGVIIPNIRELVNADAPGSILMLNTSGEIKYSNDRRSK